MYDPRQIILRPILTEKTFGLIESANQYTFEVHKSASKPQIAQAVQEIFGVTVLKVHTMNINGKPRRVRTALGKTRDWKKAIVSLKQGDKIEVFPNG